MEYHKEHKKKKWDAEKILLGLAVLLGIVMIINVVFIFGISSELKKSTQAAQESARPAKIELLTIKNSKCADCFDMSTVVSSIKSMSANITSETSIEYDSKEGKSLIEKYKVEKVPAVLIKGETEKLQLEGLEKTDDAIVVATLAPPYTNPNTGKIEGRVTVYALKDDNCKSCNDINGLINQIEAVGVKISDKREFLTSSMEGKSLIEKYRIGFAPSIILSKEASEYGIINQAWPQVGTKESDGFFVLRVPYPPYINLTTNKLRGEVSAIYLADKSCIECYNVDTHKQILEGNVGMKLIKEEKFDVSDAKGKELVSRYNITNVPTVIVQGDVAAYPASAGLKQFFSVEKDGSYVFRKLNVLGSYKDLSKNEVIQAQQQ